MAIGELGTRFSYNSVAITVFKSSISSRFIKSESGRNTKYIEYNLTVQGYVFADPDSEVESEQTTDATLEEYRILLSKSCGQLIYESKGFGALDINAARVYDVDFGPHPEVLEWMPVGDNISAGVTFRVKTTIPECDNAIYEKGLADFHYTTSTSIDQDGYLTRTISGYIEIPNTRLNGDVGSRIMNDHIDQYREFTYPEMMIGFQRVRKEFTTAPNKRSATFSYVDVQMPSPLPKNSTKFDIVETLENSVARQWVKWAFSLSGSITLAAGVPKREGYVLFLALLQQRIYRHRLQRFQPVQANNFQNFGDLWNIAVNNFRLRFERWVFINKIRVSDQVTGKSCSYHVSADILTPTGVRDVIKRSGMWEPVPESNFQTWKESMQLTACRLRGSIYFTETPQDEKIVDLCLNSDPVINPRDQGSIRDELVPQGGQDAVQDSTLPPRENTWLICDLQVAYTEDGERYARHKPMSPTPTIDLTQNIIEAEKDGSNLVSRENSGTLPTTRPSSRVGNEDIIHEVATPSPRVYLSGYCVRLGYKTPAWNIEKVGNQTAYRNRVHLWSERIISRYANTVVWETRFMVEYILKAPPKDGTLPTPTNPVLGIDGQTE